MEALNPPKRRKTLKEPVSIQQMRDGVVLEAVYVRYCNEIIHFMTWLYERDDDLELPWLTDLGRQTVDSAEVVFDGESAKTHRARVKAAWMERLRLAKTEPIVHVDRMDAEGVMEYVASAAHHITGRPLTLQGYNGKRSAIHHLIRCHNGKGPGEDYLQDISTLWSGFRRKNNLLKRKRAEDNTENANGDDGDNNSDDEDDSDEFKEGKVAMSPELYRSVCKWLVEYGSTDSIAAACFICLTWNLACRSHNTAELKFSHMSWTKFDCMQINFRHTKTDVEGKSKRKQRNLYSNINEYYIDFPFLLGLYLSCCFTPTASQGGGYQLFPGSHKATTKRMRDALQMILRLHENEVTSLGYSNVKDIGLHSIRKGAASYLASMPCGPSPVAICHRAGWSTGKVLDIYFQQLQSGDEFVGRCLSMLNFMSSDFAKSPAYFDPAIASAEFISDSVAEIFPCFHEIGSIRRILQQCLASLIHHRTSVLGFEPNHPARNCIDLFSNTEMMELGVAAVRIDNMWDTNNHISGVPPHIKELADLADLKEQLKASTESLFTRLKNSTENFFRARRLGGGEITEELLIKLIKDASNSAREDMQQHLESLFSSHRVFPEQMTGATGSQSAWNRSDGLPSDFRWPSTTILDLWRKWHIGNGSRGIPPLKELLPADVKFLDNVPLTEGEQNREKHTTDKRRNAGKTLSDIKFICNYIEEQATLHHGFTEITVSNMMPAFNKVMVAWDALSQDRSKHTRFDQLKWRTVVREARSRKKIESQVPFRVDTPVVQPTIQPRSHNRNRGDNNRSRGATNQSRGAATRSRGTSVSNTGGDLTFEEAFQDVPLHVEKTPHQAVRQEELELQLALEALDDFQDFEREHARNFERNSGLFVVPTQRGTEPNHGHNSVVERQQYAQHLNRALNRPAPTPARGRCPIANCTFDNLVADHPCYNDACSKFVHNLCAQGAGLTSTDNELNMYCSIACKNTKE